MKSARSSAEVSRVKSEILVCALEILVTEGFASLTMRGLARRTGMTAPNLYNYFASKDEIYITLMIQGFVELASAMSAEASLHGDPLVRARAVMRRYVRFAIDQRRYYELMFSQAMPKYRDYVGTANESLSLEEHKISMRLADLALGTMNDVAVAVGLRLDEKQARLALTTVWSFLHGAVSLANSQNLDYVVDDVPATIDRLIEQLTSRSLLQQLSAFQQ